MLHVRSFCGGKDYSALQWEMVAGQLTRCRLSPQQQVARQVDATEVCCWYHGVMFVRVHFGCNAEQTEFVAVAALS